MLGFGEVLAVMGVVIWLALRRHGPSAVRKVPS
jgi:hypothetical protein